MDTADLQPLVEDLTDDIDALEESLAPLLNTALSASTSKLPLLDKSKLYVLATYAIESLLFSYLRLNGVNAKEHPIFTELTRVKQYFEKIKTAESAGVKRNTTLDKGAAGRFVKHALAGNEQYDKERAERIEREKAGAKRKFEDMSERVGTQSRFENMSKRLKDEELVTAQGEEDDEAEEDEATSSKVGTDSGSRKKRPTATDMAEGEARRKSKKRKSDTGAADASASKKHASRAKKLDTAPRGHSETFQALLNGPLPKKEEGKKRSKDKKRKET